MRGLPVRRWTEFPWVGRTPGAAGAGRVAVPEPPRILRQ